MKVLFYCHFWPPYHYAGSEIMGQNILRHLRMRGHDTLAIATHETNGTPFEWEYEGTRVQRPYTGKTGFALAADYAPDLILTHHGETYAALSYAHHMKVPVVQVIHNDMDVSRDFLSRGADFVIYNTEWIRDKFEPQFDLPSCVLHPPVFADDHRTSPGDRVTLVNLNEHKGARVFYELADRMPDVQFLAVEGGHGNQIFETWPNVKHQKQTTDMRNDVWARTKILLMPSVYESYGMVGVEALASGIPVIANPTEGLMESLDYAGIFVDRDDVAGWEAAIRRLLNDQHWYWKRSQAAVQRSRELDPEKELAHVAHKLEELVWRTQR